MILGVDTGGTKTWIGLFENGRLETSVRIKTSGDPKNFLADLEALIQNFLGADRKKLKAIGVGAPGPLDIENGVFGRLSNLPYWEGFHLKSSLEQAYAVPVRIQNDANTAALGEALYGGGKVYPSVYYITMSTGIGGGLVMNRRIINGRNDLTGEIWALSVKNMGRPDILLNSTSGPGIVKNYLDLLKSTGRPEEPHNKSIGPKDVLEAAQRGDEAARDVLNNAVDCMADAVTAILHIIDPNIVLFGGGLTAEKSSIVALIRERVRSRLFFKRYAGTPLERALLWDDAVLYGALSLFGDNPAVAQSRPVKKRLPI